MILEGIVKLDNKRMSNAFENISFCLGLINKCLLNDQRSFLKLFLSKQPSSFVLFDQDNSPKCTCSETSHRLKIIGGRFASNTSEMRGLRTPNRSSSRGDMRRHKNTL